MESFLPYQQTRMSQSPTVAATMEVSPEGTQKERIPAIEQPSDYSHRLESPESAQDVKTGYWPQIAEVRIKEMISVRPDSRLPTHSKGLNSLT